MFLYLPYPHRAVLDPFLCEFNAGYGAYRFSTLGAVAARPIRCHRRRSAAELPWKPLFQKGAPLRSSLELGYRIEFL
jgi:hypothetical protein